MKQIRGNIIEWFRSVNSNIRAYVIADGFYYAGYSVINAFLSVLITTQVSGGRLEMVGFAISYYMVIRAILEIPFSRVTKNFSSLNKKRMIVGGYILYGVLIMLMGHSDHMWQIFIIQTIVATLDAIIYPTKWTLFTKIIDKDNEELEWSLEDVSSTILPAIFTAVAGLVSQRFGLEAVFILFGCLLVISGIGFLQIRETTGKLSNQ